MPGPQSCDTRTCTVQYPVPRNENPIDVVFRASDPRVASDSAVRIIITRRQPDACMHACSTRKNARYRNSAANLNRLRDSGCPFLYHDHSINSGSRAQRRAKVVTDWPMTDITNVVFIYFLCLFLTRKSERVHTHTGTGTTSFPIFHRIMRSRRVTYTACDPRYPALYGNVLYSIPHMPTKPDHENQRIKKIPGNQ